ncbi:Arabinose metabolism transcriptional repressor [Limihaloglobus sulfuriphilus]|uniref:Arabinose metabolism transcriptional repressor n=1 Tax=Limihaloglobus sulfuriphilus TaxID=1851148 RepID=A0A1Q2MD83_9BACT|nr:GntR family transcriptional regulator [Limihaloglobus sulfuriphilus]AQQ70655.1 Arabinose metabolism transcriptional repressor [Limihaloglobus sulfuriphilus]
MPARGKSGKHANVYEHIFQGIVSGKYPVRGKLPTEHELSDMFGVSRPTVSKALRMLEKKGMIDRRPGSGTYVRQTNSARGRKLGLLVSRLNLTPEDYSKYVTLYSMVISKMARSANKENYILLMNDLPYGDESEVTTHALDICRQLVDLQVKGVFFMPLEVSPENRHINVEIAHTLKKYDIAVTLMDRDIYDKPKRSEFDLVSIDNETAGFVAAEHLLSLGCRKIDFVAGHIDVSSVSGRIAGYKEALLSYGITPQESRIHHFSILPFLVQDEPIEMETVRDLLKSLDTEAIVCSNDRMAATIIKYAKVFGVNVPEDLRVVSFDDEPFVESLPVPLTTMRQPPDIIGSETVRTMISRIENPGMPARTVLISPELIVRGSCGAKL